MKALKEREHKVIYKDGDKVVKVFDETFSKADVLNEALNMARVEETGLRIPQTAECKQGGRQVGHYQRVY